MRSGIPPGVSGAPTGKNGLLAGIKSLVGAAATRDVTLLFARRYSIEAVCSGVIAWAEFRRNPSEDAESGEWTNKMLFYGLVFAITFFVGFLYLPGLYFAR